MIPLLLVLGGLTILGLAVFWKEFVGWVHRIVEKLKNVYDKIVEGIKAFIIRTAEGLKNVNKSYSKNKVSGEWEETVTRKEVAEKDVPPEILAKVRVTKVDIEVDISEEMTAALQH